MKKRRVPKPKPLFLERMKEILGKEVLEYLKSIETSPPKSIRCNRLKISPKKLRTRLEKKGWNIGQPFKTHPEIMIIQNTLGPGELGRSLEHLLGYYYIQETASMLPVIALNPKPNQIVLDMCAAPGSKTTQIASAMNNRGTILANDLQLGRIKILASNLERSGVTNTIITKRDGYSLCQTLKKQGIRIDKILIDAPCSGEGTLRTSPKTAKMWSIQTVKSLSKIQKSLLKSALDILKKDGEIVYSTCTHAPEENEEVVDYFLNNFDVKIEKLNIPIESGKIITQWRDREYNEEVKYACRVYPHEYNTEGFFLAKFKKLK